MPEDARPGDVVAPRPARPTEDGLSPSIDRGDGATEATAYELKFLVPEETAARVRAFGAANLLPDPYADADGGYLTTTLYLDTADWAILRRAEGVRGRKHRVRRYGAESVVHLERKTRRGDRVRKLRTAIPAADLALLARPDSGTDWPGAWFHREIELRRVRPVCRLTYRRIAFYASGSEGPLRLTLDRRICGEREDAFRVDPVSGGRDVLDGRVVCELKFRDALPPLFKRLIGDLGLAPSGVSKYRRFMESTGLVFKGPDADA